MLEDFLELTQALLIIIIIVILSVIFIDWNFDNSLLRALLFTISVLVVNKYFYKKGNI